MEWRAAARSRLGNLLLPGTLLGSQPSGCQSGGTRQLDTATPSSIIVLLIGWRDDHPAWLRNISNFNRPILQLDRRATKLLLVVVCSLIQSPASYKLQQAKHPAVNIGSVRRPVPNLLPLSVASRWRQHIEHDTGPERRCCCPWSSECRIVTHSC